MECTFKLNFLCLFPYVVDVCVAARILLTLLLVLYAFSIFMPF
jgi:hypothetical protein